MRMRATIAALGSLLLSACVFQVGYVPPQAPTPRDPVDVGASFGRTWDAVIDYFAKEVIPIETVERASGLIVASRAGIPALTQGERNDALTLADCGHYPQAPNGQKAEYFTPTRARYNVVVRGDSSSSRVQVTAKFVSASGPYAVKECTSKGVFEAALEAAVSNAARRPSAPRE